ncbi:MAG: hypothetical protein IT161_16535 [Bryobacterales bacterium]|nr:hypothetical protein [Bryobacterales bacterium]
MKAAWVRGDSPPRPGCQYIIFLTLSGMVTSGAGSAGYSLQIASSGCAPQLLCAG